MKIANHIFPEETIEAIGWTILHSLWQGALLAIALAVILIAMHRYSSRSRYLVAIVFMGLFLAATITTFVLMHQTYHPTGTIAANQSGPLQSEVINRADVLQDNTEETETSKSFLNTIISQAKTYFYDHIPLIVTVWLMGILVLSLRFLGSLAYIQRLKHHKAIAASKFWLNKAEMLRKKLDIRRAVQLRNSSLAGSPMAIGIFKPVILLPVKVLTGLSEKQIEAILAHELAHIKRNDYAVNILQSLLEILFFYHPAIWWMSSTIRNERENSCDDLAVTVTGETVNYAKALINIKENQLTGHATTAVYFSGNKNKFTQRIMRIIHKPTIFADFKEGFVTAFIIILGLCTITLSAIAFPKNTEKKSIARVPADDISLLNAVKKNNIARTRLLIEQGAFIDEKDEEGYTPLMQAVKNNNYDISELLIRKGANVNARNDDEWTPLMEASDEDDPRITALLVKRGADVNLKDEDNWTALLEAVDNGKTAISRLLIEYGANLEDRDEDGRTPLMLAVQKNNFELTKLLIDKGADINVENRDGWTMLMHAADEDNPDLAALLISKGADVNKQSYTGWNALFEATRHEKTEVAEILINNGAEVNITHDNFTPLRYAVKENNFLLSKLLVEHGANVNAQGKETGTTILIEAADEDNHMITNLLLDNGADVNGHRYNGWTPLYEAIKEDKNDIVQTLIQHGADVNWPNYNDLTPLMYALEEEHFEITIMLVENGADVNDQRKNGWSVMDIARKTNEKEIIDYIESKIASP